MTPRPVSQYLARFDAQDGPPPAADIVFTETVFEKSPDTVAEDDADELPPAFETAREEAYAAGFAEASRGNDEAREVAQRVYEARLADERHSWTQDAGVALASRLDGALVEIEARIAASAANILRPFLFGLLRERAVADLAESVGLTLGGRDQALLEISGPEDLLAALRTSLANSAAAIAWAPNSTVDVRIVADQTIIESQISLWIGQLEASAK